MRIVIFTIAANLSGCVSHHMLSPVGNHLEGVLLDSSCDELTDYMTTLHAISPYKLEVIVGHCKTMADGREGYILRGFR